MLLKQESGNFYLDNENSEYITFAYEGDGGFLERISNFLIGFGAVNKTHRFTEHIHYCLPKIENLKKALYWQFYGESLAKFAKEKRDEEGDLIDLIVDEVALEESCLNQIEEFMGRVIRRDLGIYLNGGKNQVEEFSLGNFERTLDS